MNDEERSKSPSYRFYNIAYICPTVMMCSFVVHTGRVHAQNYETADTVWV